MVRLTIVLTLSALAALAGCTESAGVSAQQQRVIKDAGPDEVLAAAAAILQREFGRVRVDAASRRIVTEPVEFTTQRDSGTARDLYHGRSVMRRKATFDVGQRSGATVARLRVDVERQDTARQRVMQPETHRISDAPGHETPIDRDAATSEQQNTVWTRVRRDTKLEQSLLDELREQFARFSAESEPESGAKPPASEP